MSWYRIAQGPAQNATFILGELSYYESILEAQKWTGFVENIASFVDREKNLLSEFMLLDDKKKKAKFGREFFRDHEKTQKYTQTCRDTMNRVGIFKDFVDTQQIASLNKTAIIDIIERAFPLYSSALGLYLLSQPEYTAGINGYFYEQLGKYVSASDLEKTLRELSESTQWSCLELERKDWLGNVVIPYLQELLTKDELQNRIYAHIRTYKYYAASSEFELWDENHYKRLLEEDSKKNIIELNQEKDKIQKKKEIINENKKHIIDKYDIPKPLAVEIEQVAQLGTVRIDLRVLGWSFFHYLVPKLFERSANLLQVSEKTIFALHYSEFVSALAGRVNPEEIARQREHKNILVTITSENGYQVLWGEAANREYNSQIAQKLVAMDSLKGTVANGSGSITGSVFLFDWGAEDFNEKIYAFPEGAILVAGQTRPQLMPAIRKAKAVITDEGGMLCHAAIVSRELNKPCVIGTQNATEFLKHNDTIEINLDTGEINVK